MATSKALRALSQYLYNKRMEAAKVNGVLIRRAIKIWRMWTEADRQIRGHDMMARQFERHKFMKRYVSRWRLFTDVELSVTAAGARRAAGLWESQWQRKVFDALYENAHDQRARNHFRTVSLRAHLRAWGGYSRFERIQRLAAEGLDVADDATHVDVAAMQRMLEKRAAERAAKEAAIMHAEEYAEQEEEAKREAEALQWKVYRDEAAVRLRDRHRLERQAAAQRTQAEHRREQEKQEFEDKWKLMISTAIQEEKEKAMAWVADKKNKEAKKLLTEEARNVLLVRGLEDAKQELSDFEARLDMSDGCIHYVREEDAGQAVARPRLDFNVDNMLVKEALLVAACHYAARQAVKLRNAMLEDKEWDWHMTLLNVAARKIQGMYQRRKTRLTFLQALRYRLELQSDMYTGELFYFDVHTGRSMEFPLRMCGTIFELHPPPDWMLRADVASDGNVTYSYRRPRIPRTLLVSSFLPRGARKTRNRTEKDDQVVLLLPPSGYAMCQACGINFCHKQCFGAGCDGYLYCSSCFITYHPLGDEAWVAHWDAEVCAATPVIKEGTTLPAGELLLMEGRIPPAARGVHALVGDDEAKLVVSRRPVRMKLLIRNFEEIEAAEAARREQEEEEARAREAGEDDASAGAGGRRVRRTRTGSKDGERGRSLKRTNSGSSRSNSKSMRTKSRGSERSSSKGGGGRASSNGGRRSK